VTSCGTCTAFEDAERVAALEGRDTPGHELSGSTCEPEPAPLSGEHITLLAERGIPLAIAEGAGLMSVDAAMASQMLGYTSRGHGGLAIPYPGIAPTYRRIRMDGGERRYLCPKGRPVPVYAPPSASGATCPSDLAGALVVVEAPLKALAMRAAGLEAVGLGGVATTLEKGRPWRLGKSWTAVPLAGRDVRVLFDAGRALNPQVARAEGRMVEALRTAGARVSVCSLPLTRDGADQGPDDFLVREGREALFAIVRAAKGMEMADDRDAERLEAEGEAHHRESALEEVSEAHVAAGKKTKRPAPGKPHVRLIRKGEDAWRNGIITALNRQTGEETVQRIAANVATILRFHPSWRGVIAWDAFAESTVTLNTPPWHLSDAPAVSVEGPWSDADTARLVNWLGRVERLHVSAQIVESALMVVSATRVVHPVRDYLGALEWDRVDRLSAVLHQYFAAADSPYTRGVGRRWMVALVARAYEPGCQSDCTLILESPKQGTRKTSAFRSLVPVPGWYQDTGIDPRNKDSFESLRSVWIYGLDELDSLSKGEITTWKNFLTATRDHYRPPYAHRARDFPRQNGFCGTTNDSEYLVDRTGNRRFWPVAVIGEIDTARIAADRDQLWAEAVHRYRAGEKWHVDTAEFRALCEAEQRDRLQTDSWANVIADWLAKPESGAFTAGGVLTLDLMRHAIGKKEVSQVTKADEMRVAACLRELGYERGPMHRENGTRARRFIKKGAT